MTRSELWYKVSRSIHNAARLSHDAIVDEIVALVDAYEPPRTVICKPAQGEGVRLEAPLPAVGEPVDVVPEAKFTGDNWLRTTVSRVVELSGPRGRYGFEVHGRCGLFTPIDEVGKGTFETWKRVLTAARMPAQKGGET